MDAEEAYGMYGNNRINTEVKKMASSKEYIEFQTVHIQTKEAAQNAPTPFTTFSLFYNGEFITHEILSEKKFEKILVDRGL